MEGRVTLSRTPDESDLGGLLAYIRYGRLIERGLYDEASVDDSPWNPLKVDGQAEQNLSHVDHPGRSNPRAQLSWVIFRPLNSHLLPFSVHELIFCDH